MVEQQPFGDLVGRVGGMSGFHTTPTASNEVSSIKRSCPAPMSTADMSSLLMERLRDLVNWPPGAGSRRVEPSLVDISRSRVVIRHAFATRV